MTTTEAHPIELFLAALLYLVEGTCWIINELLGHHPATNPATTKQPAKRNQSLIKRGAGATQPKPDLSALTVKQLQAATGVRSSRYRKADLIQLFIQQGGQVASDLALVHA